jgi:hypothetical protein
MSYVFDSITDILKKNLNKDDEKYIKEALMCTLNFLKKEKIYELNKKELNYLLHNIQKANYIINRKKDVFNRVRFYHKVEKILSRSDSEKLCNFTIDNTESDKKLLGKGVGGLAYKITHAKFDKPISAKVMDADDQQNMDEVEYYKRLKRLVLDFKTPHLPLTWDDLNCGNKCVFINADEVSDGDIDKKERWETIKNGKCFLIFSEFFNGDLAKFRKINTKEMLFSIIFQVICGLYVIDKQDLFHGDLNLGNVLYLDLSNVPNISNKKYIKYKYDDQTFYINHMNYLWVLWDFEYMDKKGNRLRDNFTPEYLSNFFDYKVMSEIEKKWGSYYNPLSKFISGTWMFDLIDLLSGLKIFVDKELKNITNKIYKNVIDIFLKNDMTLTPIKAIPLIFKDVNLEDLNVFIEGENKDIDNDTLAFFEY